MRTFEYSIGPDSVASDGRITVASLCGYILNAAHRTMIEEGYWMCLLSRCSFEIDERPKADESINIMVESGLNNIVTLLNRNVSLTDSEGHEIGRGQIEWLLPNSSQKGLSAENPSRLTRRFINKFRSIMPDIDSAAALQIRIDLEFKESARRNNDFSVAFKKICDSRFFFLARSGPDTLCRGMLQTA